DRQRRPADRVQRNGAGAEGGRSHRRPGRADLAAGRVPGEAQPGHVPGRRPRRQPGSGRRFVRPLRVYGHPADGRAAGDTDRVVITERDSDRHVLTGSDTDTDLTSSLTNVIICGAFRCDTPSFVEKLITFVSRAQPAGTRCRSSCSASAGARLAASASPHCTSQLASSWCPPSVSTDSGWNCTPSTGADTCRNPMITPLSVVAVTVRSSGTPLSTDNEW